MAYKSKGGCTPITAKIKHTTKGGITQPILNMGAPVKMKMSSPAKQTTPPSDDLSMTPYSVKKEYANYVEQNPKVTKKTGVIHGPKVSYDMAYEKAKKTKRYADMSKADYIKEAKRQTKSFIGTGNWDAKPKKREKVAAVSTIKSKGIEPLSKEIKIETKIDASAIKPKASKVTNEKAAKKATNKTARAARVRQKGIDALASGNSAKALRLKRREARINKRAEKQAAKAIE